MATRFYLPTSGAAPVNPPFTLQASWNETDNADRLKLVQRSKSGTAMATKAEAKASGANVRQLVRQYVSERLRGGQTISGTVKGTIRVAESAANDNIDKVSIKLLLVSEDGQTLRGAFLNLADYGPTNEWATSLTARRIADGDAITSQTTTEGDRVVLEIGFNNTTAGTSITGSMRFGDIAAADLPDNETATADDNPFVEFSADIQFAFQDTPTATIVISPSVRAVASLVDKPLATLVIAPSVSDVSGNFRVKVGSFNVGTGGVASTVQVTGVGFKPKALLLWWSGRTETADAAGTATSNYGYGFAVSTTDRRCVAAGASDNVATSLTVRFDRNDACIASVDAATQNFDGLADLQSMDDDGFTIVIDDQFPTSLRIHYMAIGGAKLTNVKSGQFASALGGGSQDVTDVGFQPDATLFLTAGTDHADADPRLGTHAITCLGAAAGATPLAASQNALIANTSQDGQAASITTSYCLNGECLARIFPGAPDFRARVTNWLSNGFRINWLEASGAFSIRCFYLCLKGGRYAVGDIETRTDGANIVETGVGFKPSGVLFGSHCTAQSTVDTGTTHNQMSLGAADSPTSRAAHGEFDENAADPTDVGTAVEHDEVYVNLDTAMAVEGLMDLVSFDSDGFTCVMDDADPSAAFVWYLAMTEPSAAPPPAIFNETVQAGPIVIVPTARALASFVDKPLRTFAIIPTVVDLGQNDERPTSAFTILPSAGDLLRAVERPLRVFAILPSVIDQFPPQGFSESPTAIITFVIRTKSRQAMVERPLRTFAVVPGSPFPDIMSERPTATIRIVASSKDFSSLSDRPRAIIVIDPSRSDGFHRIGPIETLVALWSGSSEALQSPLLVDPDWKSGSQTEEVQTFGNIGKPGQTYQVGTGTRGVTPPSGRVQTVDSDVTLKE